MLPADKEGLVKFDRAAQSCLHRADIVRTRQVFPIQGQPGLDSEAICRLQPDGVQGMVRISCHERIPEELGF